MKSFTTYLALAASLSPFAFAAPTSENALVSRASPADAPAALARMNELYASITPHTAAISTSPSNTLYPYSVHRTP